MARINDKQFLAALLEPVDEKEPRVELLRSGKSLLPVRRMLKVERWTVRNVRKASNAWDKAFKTDPLFEYMRAVSAP